MLVIEVNGKRIVTDGEIVIDPFDFYKTTIDGRDISEYGITYDDYAQDVAKVKQEFLGDESLILEKYRVGEPMFVMLNGVMVRLN